MIFGLMSGEYWIDPNEGDTRDAILVHCDMPNRATCLLPRPEKSPEINYIGEEQEIWLGEIQNGMKVSYFGNAICVIFFNFIFYFT